MNATKISVQLQRATRVLRAPSDRCIHDQKWCLDRRTQYTGQQRLLSTSPRRRLDYREELRRGELEVEAAQRQEDVELLAEQDIKAAPEIDFDKADRDAAKQARQRAEKFMMTLRIVPESPSYFTARPAFTDDIVDLQRLLRKYATLPTLKPADAPRVAWRQLDTYKAMTDEPVRSSRYKRLVEILKRINLIHPQLMPLEVQAAIEKWKRDIQPFNNRPAPIDIDEFGRAAAVGRRKASSAKAWVVEGEGDVLVNGKPLHQAFARVHDRESVVWALKATERIDKYNVFATVHGGGTTGQAEALTLAISKALMAHEPMLKPALRRGKLCIVLSNRQLLTGVCFYSGMCRS